MDRKTFQPRVEIKSADRGEVSAVFSTFNVVDKDNDVTIPGAIKDGSEVVISSYNHNAFGGSLPVGKGVVRTTKSEAIVDAKFFLDTTAGKDTFTVLKALGGNSEWSYGYHIVDAERGKFDGREVQFLKSLDVYEVSPVLVGAGVNTRTLAVKSLMDSGMDQSEALRIVDRVSISADYRAAIRPHEVAVSAKSWDVKKVLSEIPDDASIEDLRSMHAWVDPSGQPDSKSSYRIPHHEGINGPANLRACLVAIADLNGPNLAGVPKADRRGVYNHLATHLADGDRDVPDLREPDDGTKGTQLFEEAAIALAYTDNLIRRTSEVMALRRSKPKSRGVSASTLDILEWLSESQRKLRALLDSPKEDVEREFARFVRQSLLLNQDEEDGE